MKISTEQIFDIKCVLSGSKKRQIASALDINVVDLSRSFTNKDLVIFFIVWVTEWVTAPNKKTGITKCRFSLISI